jgi:hypothetical protein
MDIDVTSPHEEGVVLNYDLHFYNVPMFRYNEG